MNNKEYINIEHELDGLFQELSVGKKCIIPDCPNFACCSHHFIKRWNRATRWLSENAIYLCNNHHLATEDKRAEIMEKKIIEIKGIEWARDLQQKSTQYFKRNYAELKINLVNEVINQSKDIIKKYD